MRWFVNSGEGGMKDKSTMNSVNGLQFDHKKKKFINKYLEMIRIFNENSHLWKKG